MDINLRKAIEEWILDNFPDEEILLADGMEEAFIGIANQFNKLMAVYDTKKCIRNLMNFGMSYEEAEEYFYHNIQDAYVGENTPAFFTKFQKYQKPFPQKHIAEQFTFNFNI